MPQLRAVTTERLTLPSDPQGWVEMKDTPSYGDKAAAQEAMLKVTIGQNGGGGAIPIGGGNGRMVPFGGQQQALAAIEIQAYMLTMLSRLIVQWNFTDEHDNVLPITRANLERLDMADGEFLEMEVSKRIGGRPTDQQGPSKRP